MGSESTPTERAEASGNRAVQGRRAMEKGRQLARQTARRKAEEVRVQQLNKSAYVKSADKNIVRSSSGSAVIAGRSGERAVEQSRQIELDRIYDTPEKKLEAARIDLEARKRNTIPGILGAVSRANINQQLKALDSGASPQFSLTASGGFTTTGVSPASSGYDSTRNIAPISRGVTSDSATTPVAKASESEATVVSTKARTSSAARRALLGQSQKGEKARIFYGGR